MGQKGTCDLCSQDIEQDQGYLFYSVTVIKAISGGNDPTGLMHICDDCIDRYITEERFENPTPRKGGVEVGAAPDGMAEMFRQLQEANVAGIIALCKGHGFSATQAREKSRELAKAFWQDKSQGKKQAKTFWLSAKPSAPGQGSGQAAGGGECFIATACYGTASHRNVIVLKAFRDRVLSQSACGRAFTKAYYGISPHIAPTVARSNLLRHLTRMVMVEPAARIAVKFLSEE